MLLTSGQVSMAISSAIIFLFTSLLFLSGYVLQQQTVRNIQSVIQPRITKPAPAIPTIDPKGRASRPFGRPHGSKALQAYLSTADVPVDWTRLAYVQMVKDHREVCNAIMLFSELHRLKSPPRRVLLFPRAWAVAERGEVMDPFLDTSVRLLRKAARRYRVILVPIEPLIKGTDDSTASSYSLASIFSLTNYDRVLYLSPPGILLNSSPLDSLLAFSEQQALSALPADASNSSISTSLLLIRPSSYDFTRLQKIYPTHSSSDDALLQYAYPAPTALLSSPINYNILLSDTGSLVYPPEGFNAESYLASTAYVRLQDPELPGPEYNIPFHRKHRARPKSIAAGEIWDRMYEVFRQERMEVCGLDLETWKGGEHEAVEDVEAGAKDEVVSSEEEVVVVPPDATLEG